MSILISSLSHSFLTLNLYRTFKELSKAEEQFYLCRELCEDLAEDMKKEGLKVVNEGCFIYLFLGCFWLPVPVTLTIQEVILYFHSFHFVTAVALLG